MPGTLRVALVSHIPDLLDRLGGDSATVLQRAGIRRELFAIADNRIGYHAVGRLLDESIRSTGLAHFGVLVGVHFAPSAGLGDIVELMQNAPTIEVALRAFVLHQHLNDSGAVPMLLRASGKRFAFAYSIHRYDVPAIDAFYDAGMVYGMQVMRALCGANWQPLQVKFAHRRPADTAPYTRVFGSNIRFDSSVYAIEFAAGVLEQPIAGADPGRYALVCDEMARRLQRNRMSLADQVRRALCTMIVSGTVSGSKVAEVFSLHERVLRDRLTAEGTSVRLLIRDTRLQVAAQLLQSTQVSVSEVSAAVGYSDPPSFVRAFRNHFGGVTPGVWREQAAGSTRHQAVRRAKGAIM